MTLQLRPARTAKAATGTIPHEVLIGPHSLLSDAPKVAGGNDLGPDPHELLDAALAGCTALTLMLYARGRVGISTASSQNDLLLNEVGS